MRTTKVKKVVKKRIKKVVADTPYSVQVKIMGRPYNAIGETIRGAIESLKVGSAKGVSIITVSKGEISRNKVFTPQQTFRLFSPSKLMREASFKQVAQIFNF